MADRPVPAGGRPSGWSALFLATFLSAYLYAFMEWLFILTKPSFMDALPLGATLEMLVFAGSLLAGLGYLFLLALYLVGRLPPLRPHQPWLERVGALAPGALLAVLGLLLIDNFTYSLFRYGIVESKGGMRGVYAAGFIALGILIYRAVLNNLARAAGRLQRFRLRGWLLPAGLLLIVSGIVVPLLHREGGIDLAPGAPGQAGEKRPHILLLTSDGVDAERLSVYGYERDTTPNLRALAAGSLLAENAYTNASTTAGSIISILTGKPALKTGVVYPPNILYGKDRYQHLPGMLRSLGYRTVQISTPYYVDAYEFRLLNGFDIANGRAVQSEGLAAALNRYFPSDAAYFLDELARRAGDRLKHIFFIQKMPNVYRLVTEPAEKYSDLQRTDELLQHLEQSPAPLFAHVHFMGTHGPTFSPRQQVFSAGRDPNSQTRWDRDFSDDSLREFDQIIGQVVAELKARGLYDQTILIVGTDHGQGWVSHKRLPLLIHFPQDRYAGPIRQNVQYLDIAPTLLDYLGLERPSWMSGRSLLPGEPPERPIFSVFFENTADAEPGDPVGSKDPKGSSPRFQFVTMISCNRWYRVGLAEYSFVQGEVEGASAPCENNVPLSEAEALRRLIPYLRDNNTDPAGLQQRLQALSEAP